MYSGYIVDKAIIKRLFSCCPNCTIHSSINKILALNQRLHINSVASNPGILSRTHVAGSVKLDRLKEFRRQRKLRPEDAIPVELRKTRSRSPNWLSNMKRSRSPASPTPTPSRTRSKISDMDGVMDSPEVVPGLVRQLSLHSPTVPSYLQLSSYEIDKRWRALQAAEKTRIIQARKGDENATPYVLYSTPESKILDRYMNIQVFEKNRVSLKVPEGHCDYINASPVFLQSNLYGTSTNFIVMQGPKSNTVGHTWRMVWEDPAEVSVIIMLTQTYDGVQEKCYQYFPRDFTDPRLEVDDTRYDEDGNIQDLFNGTVELVEEEKTPFGDAIEVRKLVLKIDGQEREKTVWHLLYNKMVDFSHPDAADTESFFHLMELSRIKNGGKQNNRIVHCSAGVGRSGTFIALEHLMSELDGGGMLEPEYDNDGNERDPIRDTVNWLRMQRPTMVQADVQFTFLYDTLRHLWELKYTPPTDPNAPLPPPVYKGRPRSDTDPFVE